MKNEFILLWDKLHSSYWFIPATMAVMTTILAHYAIQFDETTGVNIVKELDLAFIDSADGARAVLTIIASSMITIVGIVFSLTMVVFSLGAQQYGSFVLESFMRDRSNQLVLGSFTAAFIYSLLILRTIRENEASIFVPHFAVLVGVLLALFSVVVLIYYIHHVSDSVKVFTIVSHNSDDLSHAIESMFPQQIGQSVPSLEQPDEATLDEFRKKALPIRSHDSGYLQMIDGDALMNLAEKHNAIIELTLRPGDFVVAGSVLGRVWPENCATDHELTNEFNDAFIIGDIRAYAQDLVFHFLRIAEIALRALSPAVNAPFTAMLCIDRLGQGLCELGNREMPSAYRYDTDHNLHVITKPYTFEEIVGIAFDQIRHYGCGDIRVVTHLLKTLRMVGECVTDPAKRDVLRRHANLIHAACQRCIPDDYDLGMVEISYQETLKALEG